jgi:hypothetical protein
VGRVALGSNPALIDHPALIEKWKLVVSIRFGALASDRVRQRRDHWSIEALRAPDPLKETRP